MKKNILVGVLLLSAYTCQAMDLKNASNMSLKKVQSEKQFESHSLLEKYVPGTKLVKKIIIAGTVLYLFGKAKTFETNINKLCENPSKYHKEDCNEIKEIHNYIKKIELDHRECLNDLPKDRDWCHRMYHQDYSRAIQGIDHIQQKIIDREETRTMFEEML